MGYRNSGKPNVIYIKSGSVSIQKNLNQSMIELENIEFIAEAMERVITKNIRDYSYDEDIKVRCTQTGDDGHVYVNDLDDNIINYIFSHSYNIEKSAFNPSFCANQKLKESLVKSINNVSSFISRSVISLVTETVDLEGNTKELVSKCYNVRDPECFLSKIGICQSV